MDGLALKLRAGFSFGSGRTMWRGRPRESRRMGSIWTQLARRRSSETRSSMQAERSMWFLALSQEVAWWSVWRVGGAAQFAVCSGTQISITNQQIGSGPGDQVTARRYWRGYMGCCPIACLRDTWGRE